MATQLQIYLTAVSPFILVWSLIFLDVFSTLTAYRTEILVGAPFLAVLCLGVYAVLTVLYGVATFNDCASARAELVKEIGEAKADLRKRKIIT